MTSSRYNAQHDFLFVFSGFYANCIECKYQIFASSFLCTENLDLASLAIVDLCYRSHPIEGSRFQIVTNDCL